MTGRTKGLVNLHIFRAVAIIVAAMFMFSCQKEQIDSNSINRVKIVPVIDRKIETGVRTRAAVDKTLYSEYEDSIRQVLAAKAVAFDHESGERANDYDGSGVFAPLSNGGWRSGVEVETGYDYDLYVYSNNMPSSSVQFIYGNGGASLEFNGLYLITTKDPLVCVSAAGAMLSDQPTPAQLPTLNQGEFNIGQIGAPSQDDESYKAFLAMDHLYAKASLSFKVDTTYNKLRTIKIKAMEISVPKGLNSGTHTYTFSSNRITPAPNATVGGDSIKIDLLNGPTALAEHDENQTCVTLTTSPKDFGYFYFLPMNPVQSMNMKLKVTYDVYVQDSIIVRSSQTTTNAKLFNGINNNGKQAERGHDYKINVTVSPSYLYRLSDDDLEYDLVVEQQ